MFASGSEVQIALAAKTVLEQDGHAVRVVSVPSMELFLAQNEDYRASLLGEEPVRIAIEAGVRKWAGSPSSAVRATLSA
jgi:transketolase